MRRWFWLCRKHLFVDLQTNDIWMHLTALNIVQAVAAPRWFGNLHTHSWDYWRCRRCHALEKKTHVE